MATIIEILREHYRLEYHNAEISIKMANTLEKKNECLLFAVQRCLGMATIAQSFGASSEDILPMYKAIKKKIMKLGG